MLYLTLEKIREFSPCEKGWKKLLKTIGKTKAGGEVLPIETILNSNGLDDALWCLRAADISHQDTIREYACMCALRVAHLWEMPSTVRQYLDTRDENLRGAARAAGAAAWAAGDAAWAAAWAAEKIWQESLFKEMFCK